MAAELPRGYTQPLTGNYSEKLSTLETHLWHQREQKEKDGRKKAPSSGKKASGGKAGKTKSLAKDEASDGGGEEVAAIGGGGGTGSGGGGGGTIAPWQEEISELYINAVKSGLSRKRDESETTEMSNVEKWLKSTHVKPVNTDGVEGIRDWDDDTLTVSTANDQDRTLWARSKNMAVARLSLWWQREQGKKKSGLAAARQLFVSRYLHTCVSTYRKGAAVNYIKHWKQVIANGVVFFLRVEAIRQKCIMKEGFYHWKIISEYLKLGERERECVCVCV
mmetsp:Transcript_34602/g.92007  ORF Transcript_34602/g.92007 Transcript_34602/m.92007 type:complete len:277 (+) Transcript_34602:267-1097(+)